MRILPALLLIAAAAPPPTLDGTWTVDLSSKPGETYTQPMVLKLQPDGTVTGSFYQSDIQAGRWKTDRGRTCVSFRTTDGVGPYHTAACLNGDRVDGQTWANTASSSSSGTRPARRVDPDQRRQIVKAEALSPVA